MAEVCANCGSGRTRPGLDAYSCAECGALTSYATGEVREPGLVWTSEVPDGPAKTARATVAALKDRPIEVTAATAATPPEPDEEDVGTGPYEGRLGDQLRALCRKRGLPVSGTNDELIDRLREN